ncbi:MAG: hypothetical protein ACPG4Q_14845 [Phycisphaeraceae bacterium]
MKTVSFNQSELETPLLEKQQQTSSLFKVQAAGSTSVIVIKPKTQPHGLYSVDL